MSLLDILFGKKPKTAAIAKNRLQLIIAHERKDSNIPHFMNQMREEIIQVIEKYLPQIRREDIKINQEIKDDLNIVEVSIPLENKDVKSEEKPAEKTAENTAEKPAEKTEEKTEKSEEK